MHGSAPPEFSKAAEAPAYQLAVTDLAQRFGVKSQPVAGVPGGQVFEVAQAEWERQAPGLMPEFAARGAYVFRLEENFGIAGRKDAIAVFPTKDQFAVLKTAGTDGINYDRENAEVIRRLRDLHRDHPFILTGAGLDFAEGRFTGPVKDPAALARRVYAFCPDVVDQGTGSVEKLAEELATGKLFLWWD